MKNTIIVVIIVAIIAVIVLFASIKKPETSLPAAQVEDSTALVSTSTDTSSTVSTTASSTAPAIKNATTTTSSPDIKEIGGWTFRFTGYGPGKEHVGTFTSFKVNAAPDAKVGAKGTVTIDAKSVSTGISRLDGHLCSDDFFDCATYPAITFTLTSIVPGTDANTFIAKGNLSFHGVEKALSFPITKDAAGMYKADFRLDTTPFNFKYVGIYKEVRIEIAGTLK